MLHLRMRNNLYLKGMDPWDDSLDERKIKRLKNSWAGIFHEHILPVLPVTKLKDHYDLKMGRPSKELYTVFGACVLQQFFDLTDAETCDQLAFNQQWHYALDILDEADQILSLKTLWNMRKILLNSDLINKVFDSARDQLANAYGIDKRLQRLDSVHIHSNMARLGRVRLLARVILNFLKNLKRQHESRYETVSDEIKSRYLKNDDPEYFGNVNPSGSKKRLEDIAQDLFQLIGQFKNEPDVVSMYSYQNLERVCSEHCTVENEQVRVKPAPEVSSASLQNPSDPDATYDGHKGQGFKVQMMETYTPDKSAQEALQLITYVNVEPAHCSDAAAIAPALETAQKQNVLPEELTADTIYGGQKNVEKAKELHVNLIAPVPGKQPANNLTDFKFDANTGEVTHCPEGHTPQKIKHNKKGSITCIWKIDTCQNCPLNAECAVKKRKKGYFLSYSRKEVAVTLRRQYQQSDAFKNKYRFRSGIEATNSHYIHQTGARRLRYRGLKRVDYAARLKAIAINVFRAARFVVLQRDRACMA